MKTLPAELLPCPSCHQAMAALCITAVPVGHLTLDYCASCRGFWFDVYESTQLAPASILELFRIIRDAQHADMLPVATRMGCPRCRVGLVETHDVVRTGPFAYHRCPVGHGRFTSFSQFLTEKGFVRHLAQTEVARIAANIVQINCHACGGPINLRSDTACPHCRSPIAVLDVDAMTGAFEGYNNAAVPRIREVTGNLFVKVRNLPFLPQRRAASLLELGIGAVAGLFDGGTNP